MVPPSEPVPAAALALALALVLVLGGEATGVEFAGSDAAGAALSVPVPFEEPHAPSSSVEASPATRLRTMRRGFKEVPFVGGRVCLLP